MESAPDFRITRTAKNSADYEQLFCDITEAVWPGDDVVNPVAYIARGTAGQRALFVTTLFARLVDNGGLASFFESASFYSRNVAEGLALLGCSDLHQTFLKSLDIVALDIGANGEPSGEYDLNRNEPCILSGFEIGRLETMDHRLYKGSSVESQLFPCFKQYVDAHPHEFFEE
jgi:hypothetical protein